MASKPTLLLMAAALLALLLSACGGDSPEDIQAKAELAAIDSQIAALQAKIDGLPAMEVPDEIRAGLEMQRHCFGLMFAVKVPGSGDADKGELDEVALMTHMNQGGAAAKKRGLDMEKHQDQGPLNVVAAAFEDVPTYRDDLNDLLNTADTFDNGVRLARGSVEVIPDLTVPRQKGTEKYFQQHAEKKATYEAMAASLEGKSSEGLRAAVGKLKMANEVFYEVIYWYFNIGTIAFAVPEELKDIFPDLVDEAEGLAYCWMSASSGDVATCTRERWWPERFLPLVGGLHDAYAQLEEEI